MPQSTRTIAEAINYGRTESRSGRKNYYQLCLKFVRNCYNVMARYSDANEAWANTKYRHAGTNYSDIPAGAILWWNVGKYGHVALCTGNGKCLSNDILRKGKIDEVAISLIGSKWGASFRGWSEDVNNVRVMENTNVVSVQKLRVAMRVDAPKVGRPLGPNADQVLLVEKALQRIGFLSAKDADGHYGTATVDAVKRFQVKHSNATSYAKADGWLGQRELVKLFKLAGSNVKVVE